MTKFDDVFFLFTNFRRLNIVNEATSPYSLTPISSKSQKLLRSPRKATRKISKLPFKVLDAPELADDFYLNLVCCLVSAIVSGNNDEKLFKISQHTGLPVMP